MASKLKCLDGENRYSPKTVVLTAFLDISVGRDKPLLFASKATKLTVEEEVIKKAILCEAYRQKPVRACREVLSDADGRATVHRNHLNLSMYLLV